jgi:hypothetical protein
VGDPDLSAGATSAEITPTLAELLLACDAEALASFYDTHSQTVLAYCGDVCPPELVEEAALASFVDFLGRLRSTSARDPDLDALLSRATRTAAAGRLEVEPRRAGRRVPHATCRAMPVLLGAYANREYTGDERAIRRHVKRCAVCRGTAARMERAERAFEGVAGGRSAPGVRAALLRGAHVSSVDQQAGPGDDRSISP